MTRLEELKEKEIAAWTNFSNAVLKGDAEGPEKELMNGFIISALEVVWEKACAEYEEELNRQENK